MARSRPVLLTAALSAAAVLGYLTYRLVGAPEAPSADEAAAAAPPAVAMLPDFSLANLAGEQQSIQSWPGKPLLINFWATWCGPCLREIPMLKELQAARPDLQVVGIAIDKPDLVAKFAADAQFNYAILIGQNEAWAAAGALGVNIYALPFTIFTGGDGSILGVHTGELHAEHLATFQTVADAHAAGRISVEEARGRIASGI
jgi:thiol-disulfide isomerase/thioredoxin